MPQQRRRIGSHPSHLLPDIYQAQLIYDVIGMQCNAMFGALWFVAFFLFFPLQQAATECLQMYAIARNIYPDSSSNMLEHIWSMFVLLLLLPLLLFWL